MADPVLRRIRRRCTAIERAYHQGSAGRGEVLAIDISIANMRRVEDTISAEAMREIVQSLTDLRSVITAPPASIAVGLRADFHAAQPLHSGRRGRPGLDITREQIELLLTQGITVRAMARMLGCSSSYMHKKLKYFQTSARSRFTPISDADLEEHVRRLHNQFPRSGSQMMCAYLHADRIVVQRRRVRETLNSINPAAAAQRWSQTVARRTYHVPFPNSLWHIDGHMRLIRWGFVTHGCIDGKSRLITYINCSTDNTALTVLTYFVAATCVYGLPSRVRSDHGGENTLVALLMNLLQGQGHVRHITGRSVHNQRIERLWRDVFQQVVHYFYQLFYSFEDEQILNPDDNAQKMALQVVYRPEIQKHLNLFRHAWNNHKIRTANNRTPTQIWMEGMLANSEQESTAINNVFGDDPYRQEHLEAGLARHGIQLAQLQADSEDLERAVVVSQPLNLSSQQQQHLQNVMDGTTDLKDRYMVCAREIQTWILTT
ncbi:hypothetical protein N1851_026900 [Merluccius polli]|uniref:Integrase catalytic domain-containing protein n=1 Tax=Merluccius polli TaxID=89951 RepID=A0AA47MB69_MERPO|nr:hypothetical protein N1851_026900 [Merluccius polli]